MKVCTDCGADFKPRCNQKRCESCLNEVRTWTRTGHLPRKCGGCGGSFKPTNGKHRFCSPACRPHRTHHVPGYTRACRACGNEFKPISNQRYCDGCRPGYLQRRASQYRQHKGTRCERCGFEAKHACQLDVHHKDGDSTNDHPTNLQTVCANCHRLDLLGPRLKVNRTAQDFFNDKQPHEEAEDRNRQSVVWLPRRDGDPDRGGEGTHSLGDEA